MLGKRTGALIRGERRDLSIVIKPHPVTADHHPDWLATWRALAAADPHVHLVDDPAADVMPYLKAADVLVSDASSVIFEYLALDRPIILLTNPDRRKVAHFDPNGIEWRWRDVGIEVHDVAKLSEAVSVALDNPALQADRRAHYRQELFGDYTDGRAAERIGQKITALGL
jgi:teichoic acid glycerol-phosphate transferase